VVSYAPSSISIIIDSRTGYNYRTREEIDCSLDKCDVLSK